MLRKSLLLCIIAPLLFAAYASISACTRGKAKVCGIRLSGYNNYYDDTAIISGVFKFHASAATTDQLCLANVVNPFITSSYAFKKCYEWQNDLDTATFRLMFDKKIIAGADTLFPLADILQHAAFKKFVPISGRAGCASVEYRIGSDDTMATSYMVFDTGIYKATFTCTTTDGKALVAKLYIQFKQ